SMTSRRYDEATVWQCGSCKGLFLDRSDLNALVEAENMWHSRRSPETAPLPRITEDMTEPPKQRRRSRSFLDALFGARSEEHTSELQSRFDLVCRLLLEKKKHNLYTDMLMSALIMQR